LQDPNPTPTLTSSPPPDNYLRPLIVVQSYTSGHEQVAPGQDFTLSMLLFNAGQKSAQNVVATFTSTELVARNTGGVVAVGTVHPNNRADLSQPMTVSFDVWGQTIASVDMMLTYSGEDGTAYTEKFTLTISITPPRAGGATATPTPTATAVPSLRPLLIISSYSTDVSVLQPGNSFNVSLNVQNVGNALAKRVTMIVGGGSTQGTDNNGTPVPGGTSGSGGEFTNFAPLGSSNVQSLGDMAPADTLTANQSLIVNVSTVPGAYSLKISFTYTDDKNRIYTDDQVITLLVYSIPMLDVDFYTMTQDFYAGQPGMLPLQVINIGRKSVILGNMRATAEGATIENGVVFVGALEPGGYFPLDAMIYPDMPGPLDLTITIDYTDDFNQPQQVSKVITLDVLEAPVFEPMPEGEPGVDGGFMPEPVVETFWQKLARFVKGLIGLDSAQVATPGEMFPMEPMPVDGGVEVMPGKPMKGP